MAHVSRADVGNADPAEWKERTARARAVRKNVADQLAQALTTSDMTGSWELLIDRIRMASTARGVGDPMVERAAVMEIAEAAGALVADYDLKHPTQPADKGRHEPASPHRQTGPPAAAAAAG